MTGDICGQVMRKVDLIRKNMVKSVKNERNILAMTNNPFVVSFYYSFTNASNLYIVMEYCNGGDCYNLLKGLGCMSEGVARLYTAETVLALEYCHTKVSYVSSPLPKAKREQNVKDCRACSCNTKGIQSYLQILFFCL